MKIKWKLTIYSTVWLTLILIIFNILLYFSFIRVSTESEIALLYNTADSILSDGGIRFIKDKNKLQENLVKNEIIRVIDTNGVVLEQVTTEWKLTDFHPIPVHKRESQVIHTGGQTILFVRVPITIEEQQFGTLEIGRSLTTMDAYVQTLSSIQFGTTLLSVLFSLGGGYVFAYLALQPISQIIYTIKDIHWLGLSKRLEVSSQSRDEIYELSVTFNEMLDRIEEAFHSQKRFLADASHELRTPLTIIESYANLLRRWGAKDPEIQEEAIREIQSEAKHLKELTESLLNITDIEKGKMDQAEEIDLIPFFKRTIDPIRHVYHRTIKFQTEQKRVLYKINEQRLKQILVIFLDNAIKYSEKDVEVKLTDLHDAIEIRVIDKGIGIPEEDLPYIFDRFYRVDKVRSRETGGKGLGLSIAQSIVLRLGGTIQVLSEVGKGTEIVVRLPRK
ncbi:MAG TPA: HAMP domain-containing histidine kinase [Bacillota bacterium]|nr:HAMP domain-containing histidine kinase [Bacillota bacterium]